ncbi:hypothetical protein [Bacillus sp. FJAT-22090]|uniref:hypothetical protein n=1 Tax=Bacillus sp. FJAT-22090 TaxID=1581038 RepID=UPI0011A912BD|nr:hypothetical protein [Bacillus sp. FJAT-22090]
MNLTNLEKLLSYSKYGDEDGLKPNLTSDEIATLEWAVGTIQKQEETIQKYVELQFNVREENNELRDALEFYANKENHLNEYHDLMGELPCIVQMDSGRVARIALK